MKVKLLGKPINLLIGMDAEFFLRGPDGQYIAAARVIPGLKHQPHKLKHGVCHPDGLSMEVGCPPSDTPEGMIQNLFKVLDEVNELYLKPQGCTIAFSEYVDYTQVKGVQPEDLAFGCGVEYIRNTSNMVGNRTRNVSDKKRYSGFHIHLGYTEGQEDNYFTYLDNQRLVEKLDGLFSSSALQTTKERATQYGGVGAFRVKPYGLEYRMMDCRVITDPDRLRLLVSKLNKLPEVFASF